MHFVQGPRPLHAAEPRVIVCCVQHLAQHGDRGIDLAFLATLRDAGQDLPEIGLRLVVVARSPNTGTRWISFQVISSRILFDTFERAIPSASAMSSAVSGRSDR